MSRFEETIYAIAIASFLATGLAVGLLIFGIDGLATTVFEVAGYVTIAVALGWLIVALVTQQAPPDADLIPIALAVLLIAYGGSSVYTAGTTDWTPPEPVVMPESIDPQDIRIPDENSTVTGTAVPFDKYRVLTPRWQTRTPAP